MRICEGPKGTTYAFGRHLSADWPLVSSITEGLSVNCPPLIPHNTAAPTAPPSQTRIQTLWLVNKHFTMHKPDLDYG